MYNEKLMKSPVKLHLGCGQRYLEGYINIDFPLNKHSAQKKSIADKHADILKLNYDSKTIGEVRLHHVFEHFTRPVACALLVSWREWLVVNGKVDIEVPDFERTARSVLSRFGSERQKRIGLRHIFGSNEESWAVHYEGWTAGRMQLLLNSIGYNIDEIKKNDWKGTYNFEVIASKNGDNLSRAQYRKAIIQYLSGFLVDDSAVEKEILKYWLNEYDDQIKKSWPKKSS
jgi:hypothetical protein